MSALRTRPPHTGRALVLGGGALRGGAWEAGVLLGLADAQVDLAHADMVIGTSAGAVLAAQLAAGISPRQIYQYQTQERAPDLGPNTAYAVLFNFLLALLGPHTPRRATLCSTRLARCLPSRSQDQSLQAISSVLHVSSWPKRPLRICATDSENGQLHALDGDSAVDLLRAVTASSSLPGLLPPVPLLGRRFVDGGMYSPANGHQAAGYRRVVILAPVSRLLWRRPTTQAQVEELRANGAEVVLITPDVPSRRAIGLNPLSVRNRLAAARAGRAQATTCVDEAARLWNAVDDPDRRD